MASTKIERSIARWKHNREFIGSLDLRFNDWIITGAFYAGLHAVETLLIADNAPDHSKHGKRHSVLQLNPRYDQLYPSYNMPYQLAHVKRYSAQPRMWTDPLDIEPRVFERGLYPVEEEVRRLLSLHKPTILFPPHQPIALKR